MAEPARARRTPYEIVFVDGGHDGELLPAIAREAEARDVDDSVPERMLLLEGAGELLRRLRPEGDAGAPGAGEYGALVFHGYHFWRADSPLFVLDADLARALLSTTDPVGDWELAAPSPAGYLQLPRHLLWVPDEGGGTPEPADGFFWTLAPGLAGGRRLLLALILGLRPGRPGFGVISVDAPIPPAPAAHWADIDARQAGRDFANVLPGGEIEGLHALTSVAEVLKLASRVFHYVALHGVAGDVENAGDAGAAGSDAAADSPSPAHALPPTSLAFRRIGPAADG